MESEDEKISKFVESQLQFEATMGKVGTKTLAEIEEIAWDLHEGGSLVGTVMLGDKLLSNRISFSRRGTNAAALGKELLNSGFEQLNLKSSKTHWDWYYLGICY